MSATSSRRHVIHGLFSCAALLASVAAAPAAASANTTSSEIVDLPISFEVQNTNTSGVPCPSDGAPYTVRGHLVAPRSALQGPDRAVTLYLHGFNVGGETNWHFKGYPGYDYATELAELGHASLVVDRLGYDSSGFPHGFQTCIGSVADVAHQLIEAARSGTYSIAGGNPVPFSRVVLAGHDSGSTVAEVESYSYQDIDGLIVMDYAETGFTPTLLGWAAEAGVECAQGGSDARPGGPGGYVHLGPADEEIAPLAFPNAEPELVEAIIPFRRLNPCAELASVSIAGTTNTARLREVAVPVLIAGGDTDVAFTEDGMRRQRDLFTGSPDVTVEIFEDTGHFPMAGRTAPVFRSAVSGWLRTRGFLSAGERSESAPASSDPPAKCKKKKRKGKKRKCKRRRNER